MICICIYTCLSYYEYYNKTQIHCFADCATVFLFFFVTHFTKVWKLNLNVHDHGVLRSTVLGLFIAVNIPTVTNRENEHTPLTLGQNHVSLCAKLNVISVRTHTSL